MVVRKESDLNTLIKLCTKYKQSKLNFYIVEDCYYQSPYNTSNLRVKHRLVAEWIPYKADTAIENFLDKKFPKTLQNLEHSIRIENENEEELQSSLFYNIQTFTDALKILGIKESETRQKDVIVFTLGHFEIYFNFQKEGVYIEYDEDPKNPVISTSLENLNKD